MRDKSFAFCGEIKDKTHYLNARVYYADTDFSGVVYHGRYLEFLERGRSDFLRLCGVHHHVLAKAGHAWVVRRMEIDFKKPAKIDDVLTIQSKIITIGGAHLTMQQIILCKNISLLFAKVEVVFINGLGRPQRFPKDILAIWQGLS